MIRINSREDAESLMQSKNINNLIKIILIINVFFIFKIKLIYKCAKTKTIKKK